MSVPCDVERDSTHANQILCYTRCRDTPVHRNLSCECPAGRWSETPFVPHPRKMPEAQYVVRVTVSGVPIPDSKICNGYYKSYYCSLYVSFTREAPYCRCVCRSWVMSLKLFSGGLVPHTHHLLPESGLWPPRYHLSACRAFPGSSLNPFYKTVCQMSCRLAGLNPRTDLHRRVRKQHAAELQRPQRPVSEVRRCSPTFVNVKTQELS